MRTKSALLIRLGLATGAVAFATYSVSKPRLDWPGLTALDGSSRLANGERVQPVGNLRIPLPGDLPLAIVPSRFNLNSYIVTGGYHDHGIVVMNLEDQTQGNYIRTTKCTGGLVETEAGSGFFSAGDLGIRSFSVSSNKDEWAPVGFKLPDHAWIQGLALLPDGKLVASDMNHDKILCLDPKSLGTVWSADSGHKPNRVAVSPDGTIIAVTNWGGSSVTLLSADGAGAKTVAVGIHPSELIFARDATLFVSNAGSNSVSIIKGGTVVATVFTSLTPNDLVGSTPTGLSLSPDERTLLVANSGSNNLGVVDVSDKSHPKVKGFVPTGSYPTTVEIAPDGKRFLVGTAKGMKAAPNYPGIKASQTVSDDLKTHYDYLPDRLDGDLMIGDLPSETQLAEWTKTCETNAEREMNSVEVRREEALLPTLRKIKHVVYVIRENRSFDQVLGDLKGVNADPKLCMYGEQITPNGHKLARTFKTFDNLYCDGEVSQDGHQWCCSSYCTDFTEKAWPSSYADRGQADQDDSLTVSPGGYLWDNCRKHGLSYRSYGEFASFQSNKESAPKFNGDSGLAGHASLEWSTSNLRDKDRVGVFIQDMKHAESNGDWPAFMVMSLGEDHTAGRSPGDYTPFSKVASNDVGLGKLIEAVSHSKFWADTAIFVIEDDAQDGPDHLDGHRTVGYVASPYIARGGADHTMYSTASMVRTMELILGLPPMSQHDRHATSMVASFTSHPYMTPFDHLEARIDLEERNPKYGSLAAESAKLDFTAYDRADPDKLNRILWADAKPGIPYPRFGHLAR